MRSGRCLLGASITTWRLVTSEHLVRVYDAALEDNFFYAMEYFPLGSLASPTRELSHAEIIQALHDAAHRAGWIAIGLHQKQLRPSQTRTVSAAGALIAPFGSSLTTSKW